MTTVAQPSLVNVSALTPVGGGPLAMLAAALGAPGSDQGKGDFAAVLAQRAGATQPTQSGSALATPSGRTLAAAPASKSVVANVPKARSASALTANQSAPLGSTPDPASILDAAPVNAAVAASAPGKSAASGMARNSLSDPLAASADIAIAAGDESAAPVAASDLGLPADVAIAGGPVGVKVSDLVQGPSSVVSDPASQVLKTDAGSPPAAATEPGKIKDLPQARVNALVSSDPSGALGGLAGAGPLVQESGPGGDDQSTVTAAPSDSDEPKAASEKAKTDPLAVATGAEAADIPLQVSPPPAFAQAPAPASRSDSLTQASSISQKPPVALQGPVVPADPLEIAAPALTKAASEAEVPAPSAPLAADPAQVLQAALLPAAVPASDLKAFAPSPKGKASVSQFATSASTVNAIQSPASPVANEPLATAATDGPSWVAARFARKGIVCSASLEPTGGPDSGSGVCTGHPSGNSGGIRPAGSGRRADPDRRQSFRADRAAGGSKDQPV
jgi:hypothetical protein